MKYVNYVTYTSEKEKVAEHRPEHRRYVSGLLDQGKLALAGPFSDDSGALFIYEADSAEAASSLVEQDPFSIHGVFREFELKPWDLVFSDTALLNSRS